MAYEISISEKITLTIQEAAKLKDKYTHIELELTWNCKFQCRGKFHHALKILDFIELYKAKSEENWYN